MTVTPTRDVTRLDLAALPTPLHDAPRLAEWVGVRQLLVKRDDLTGFALGGTAVRKLERLGAEALARRADALVTGGLPGDDHLRVTAAVAARLGVSCHLAIGGPPLAADTDDLRLARLLGADVRFTGAGNFLEVDWSIEQLATRLAIEGRRPFAIPTGAATVNGAIGAAIAGDELRAQLVGAPPDVLFVAAASGATYAGLLAAVAGHVRVIGVDTGRRPDLADAVERIAGLTAGLLGRPTPSDTDRVLVEAQPVDGAQVAEAARVAARTEGLVLDLGGTALALAALVRQCRAGALAADQRVVLWEGQGARRIAAGPR